MKKNRLESFRDKTTKVTTSLAILVHSLRSTLRIPLQFLKLQKVFNYALNIKILNKSHTMLIQNRKKQLQLQSHGGNVLSL